MGFKENSEKLRVPQNSGAFETFSWYLCVSTRAVPTVAQRQAEQRFELLFSTQVL